MQARDSLSGGVTSALETTWIFFDLGFWLGSRSPLAAEIRTTVLSLHFGSRGGRSRRRRLGFPSYGSGRRSWRERVLLLFRDEWRPRFGRTPDVRAGADRLIGMHGIVTERIDPELNRGEVRVDGESWRAEAPGTPRAAPIERGTHVTVLGIRGARIVVRPKED